MALEICEQFLKRFFFLCDSDFDSLFLNYLHIKSWVVLQLATCFPCSITFRVYINWTVRQLTAFSLVWNTNDLEKLLTLTAERFENGPREKSGLFFYRYIQFLLIRIISFFQDRFDFTLRWIYEDFALKSHAFSLLPSVERKFHYDLETTMPALDLERISSPRTVQSSIQVRILIQLTNWSVIKPFC